MISKMGCPYNELIWKKAGTKRAFIINNCITKKKRVKIYVFEDNCKSN